MEIFVVYGVYGLLLVFVGEWGEKVVIDIGDDDW